RRFVAATELTQVLASGVPRAPCEPFVAELLAFDVRSRHETLYQGILRLPPGHWMTVTGRDVCVRRYWAPNPHAELAPASDADYAAQCAELLGRVVADRAPAGGTTGAYLSGGLDSSSVVCAAHAIGRPIETFSMVFPDAPDADETPYIDAVCSHVRVPNHRRAMTAIDADRYGRTAGARADLPELPGDAIGWPLLEAMRDRGLTAALTGAGGDYGFTGSFSHYADLLRQGDIAALVRRLKHDRVTEDAGWSWQVLFSSGFRLLVPTPVRRAVRPVARTLGWGTQVPPWIDAAFARRTGLLDRLSAPLGPDDGALPSRVAVCGLFESGWTARLLEAGDRAAADYGIELRHPFFDRRLVEFAVALPERQRWRGATTKFVLREAMRERLPETVYARTGKADASAFVPRAIEALGGAPALERLRIAGAGWVDGAAIAAAYRRARLQFARGDEDYCAGMFPVWMALAVETWFVTMFVEDEAHDRAEGQGAAFGRERSGARGRGSGRAPAVSVPRTG
ncbi:MAG: asparagine synthase-related protein, partial [Vicinamibacterales bacterium]